MQLGVLEKFLLIAHHPLKRRLLISEIQLNHGIIGAILLELSLQGKVSIVKDQLIIKDINDIQSPIIKEVANIINTSHKPRKIKYWVMKLARKSPKYKWYILNQLVKKQLIAIEEKRFLGLFPYKKSSVTDRDARSALLREIHHNIISPKELSEEDAVMLGLVEACKIYKAFSSDRAEISNIKSNLKGILKDNPIASSIDQTVKQVQSAIIISVVTSTTAATTATTINTGS